MGRWEPDAQGRLARAAIELYAQRGFEQTTVAEIAESAGVTERTFFRYFADKREVLFDRTNALESAAVAAVADTAAGLPALEIAVAAMQAASAVLQDRRDYARQRSAVLAANPALRERELLKMSRLGEALTEALRGRGVPDLAAGLAAEAGVTAFHFGFQSWIAGTGPDELSDCIRAALDELRALTAETSP